MRQQPRQDHYAALGLRPTATSAEIKKAYRKLVAKYHPDRHQGNDLEELAQERLVQINAAYAVLRDRRRRLAYDRGQPDTGHGARTGPQAPRLLRPVLTLLSIAAMGFLMRALRNPRIWAWVAAGVAVAWGISIWRKRQ
jgi:preprotein translocase subunit Sec63